MSAVLDSFSIQALRPRHRVRDSYDHRHVYRWLKMILSLLETTAAYRVETERWLLP